MRVVRLLQSSLGNWMHNFYKIQGKLIMEVDNFPMKRKPIIDNWVLSVSHTIKVLVKE